MKKNKIILFHNITALKMRIGNVLENLNIDMITANEGSTYFNLLNETEDEFFLIILDLPQNPELSMDLIFKTREKLKDTPIIVMTDSEKEKFYIEALLKGATDFIIKPFLDQTLISKINKYTIKGDNNRIEFITLDLSKYIKGELRKAEKGKFPLSLLLLNFENNNGSSIDPKLAELVFENIKDIFWETDVFIKFASKYYLGAFPFCSEENTHIILEKMQNRFTIIQSRHKELREYSMVTSFSTYPHDSNDTSQIFNILIDRIDKT